jgi:hypothetical protein
MAVEYPVIGRWYRRSNGSLFEIVAVDLEDGTIEMQYFDGTIDEIDLDTWPQLLLESVGAPEDWTGSVDMDPEDFSPRQADDQPSGYLESLDSIDTLE